MQQNQRKEGKMMYNNDEEKDKGQDLNLDELEKVVGGAKFNDVPRVPEHQIDESLRNKS